MGSRTSAALVTACASAAMATLAASRADATVTLPDATSEVIVTLNSTQHSQSITGAAPNHLTISGGHGTSATGNMSFSGLPHTTGTASVHGAPLATNAETFSEYYFEILGPANEQVPSIIISASGGVTQPPASSNSVQLFLGTPSSTQLIGSACLSPFSGANCAGLPVQANFSIASPFPLALDTPYNIQMNLFVNANTFVGGTSDSQSAFLDPGVTINPLFPDARDFTLAFSPGVGGVPEPSTWAMMLLGFAGIGFAGYRRSWKGMAVSLTA